jgi:hypothetical protein
MLLIVPTATVNISPRWRMGIAVRLCVTTIRNRRSARQKMANGQFRHRLTPLISDHGRGFAVRRAGMVFLPFDKIGIDPCADICAG